MQLISVLVLLCAYVVKLIYEPPRGKTNNVVSEQVRHKSGCTVTEKNFGIYVIEVSVRTFIMGVCRNECPSQQVLVGLRWSQSFIGSTSSFFSRWRFDLNFFDILLYTLDLPLISHHTPCISDNTTLVAVLVSH